MSDSYNEGDEEEYWLLMPFVVTKNGGGELDDRAFARGYECGHIDAEITMCARMPQDLPACPSPRYVSTDIVPQLDLIAMRHGYVMAHETSSERPEWSWVEFAFAQETDVDIKGDQE